MGLRYTKEGLIREYKKFFQRAKSLIKKGEFDKALKSFYYSAMVEWLFPINYAYIDESMEASLGEIADNIIDEDNFACGNPKKAVLYNGQINDSGALTQQYLYYLLDHGYEVLFVVFGKERCYGKGILEYVTKHPRVTICIPESENYVDRIRVIYKSIVDFRPSLAFLHFLPNDVIGYCVFSKLAQLPRYYIVHNDHTFWLGKNCSDYFLEFRAFGKAVSVERRKIKPERILMLPYYPIVQNVPFQGFPCEVDGKVIGMSGATLYKYTMDPDLKYLHAIKRLLDDNPNFVFFLAGGGSPREVEMINHFIQKEQIENRFFYIGHRTDFYSLVGHVDILFESYPFIGGLTVLYATNQKKAIVGVSRADALSGVTEDNFDLVNYRQPRDFNEFYVEATKLINDKDYRQAVGESVSDNQFQKKCFEKNLTNIIEKGESIHLRRDYELILDDEKILNDYLSISGGYRYTLYANKYKYIYKNIFTDVLKVFYFIKYQGVSSFIDRIKK